MVTQLLIYKIAQLAIIMAIGFALVKFKVLKSTDSATLSKMSLYLFMPATIINAFNKELTAQVMEGLGLAFIAAIVLHIVFLILDQVCKRVLKCTTVERTSIMYSNSGNLIVPIVGYVLGGEWVIYSCAFLIVALILTWTHEVRLFNKNEKFNIWKILLNVNMITILFCFAIVAFGIKLPTFCYEITGDLGGMLAPSAMLVAGMLAASIDFKKYIKKGRLYLVTFCRLVAIPFIILGLFKLVMPHIDMPNADKILLISFLTSITPSASTVIQMSQVYGDDVNYAVVINFATTLFCVLTMPILVALF